jgi:PAS domain S-box-containing protein
VSVPRLRSGRAARCLAALAAVLLGGGGVAAWAAGVPRLTTLGLPLPTLNPVTALLILSSGIGLALSAPDAGYRRRLASWLVGWCVALVAAAAMADRFLGGPIGVGALLFRDQVLDVQGTPGPAPHTAAGLLAVGLALALTDADRAGGRRPLTMLAPLPGTVAIAASTAYPYGLLMLEGRPKINGMSAPAVIALAALSAGLVSSRDSSLRQALAGTGRAASVRRGLLALLAVGATALGVLSSYGWWFGSSEAALTTSLLAGCAMLGGAVGHTISALHEVDSVQQAALRELAEQRDRERAILGSLREGVVVVDRDGRITQVNRAWASMTGHSAGDLVGCLPPWPWLPPEAAEERFARAAEVLEGSDSVEYEATIMRSDGTDFTALVSVTKLAGGRPASAVLTFKDVTDRSRELIRRAAELERANRELADAAQFRSDVMAMLAHEVKQPLFVIGGQLARLRRRWDRLDPARRWAALDPMEQAAQQMTTLVEDLLLTLRLEAGGLVANRAPVPVADVVGEAVAAAGVEVRFDGGDGVVLADRNQLRQVIVNLLTNAVKYGEAPIEIVAGLDGDWMEISVRDHGPGVPPAFVPHLFDRFTRAVGASGTVGTGLGLFIIRKLVEANGGSVDYRPAEPRGACFTVHLQCVGATTPAASMA